MKRMLTTKVTLALLLPVVPLWAGDEEHKQCEQSAAVCAETMKEQFSKRGWVGINMDYDQKAGVTVVSNVVANSPAERAGFAKGDVLRGLNGVEYNEENEKLLKEQYASFQPGSIAIFTVGRDGKNLDLEVQLESIPEAILAQWIGQHVMEYHKAEAELARKSGKEKDESP
jgi:predicted metalloprotease with PDZ domain